MKKENLEGGGFELMLHPLIKWCLFVFAAKWNQIWAGKSLCQFKKSEKCLYNNIQISRMQQLNPFSWNKQVEVNLWYVVVINRNCLIIYVFSIGSYLFQIEGANT